MKPVVSDIVWHNSDTNETQIWFMDDERITRRATVLDENGNASFVGLPWSIVGVGDVNGDGKADIVWHNSETGETQIWFMNDERIARRATVLNENGNAIFVGLPWSIVGVGDVNGDGKADIVWHNSDTNETQIGLLSGNHD
jgi:hypothetical protein